MAETLIKNATIGALSSLRSSVTQDKLCHIRAAYKQINSTRVLPNDVGFSYILMVYLYSDLAVLCCSHPLDSKHRVAILHLKLNHASNTVL
jgi:hypothetical protein